MLTALTIAELSALLSIASARSLLEVRDQLDTRNDLSAGPSPEWHTLNEELARRIAQLSGDAQIEFIALVFLGRGDVGCQGWQSFLKQAAQVRSSRVTMVALMDDSGLDGYLRAALNYLASPTGITDTRLSPWQRVPTTRVWPRSPRR